MPNETTKLKLKKPLLTEAADIDVINENMDLLDAAIPTQIILSNFSVSKGNFKANDEAPTGKEDDTSGYPYYGDYAIQGMTDDISLESFTFSKASADAGAVNGVIRTMDGKIRIYADSLPTADVGIASMSYWMV